MCSRKAVMILLQAVAFITVASGLPLFKGERHSNIPSQQGGDDLFLNQQLLSGYIHVGQPGGEMFYILVPYMNHSLDDPDDKEVPLAVWLTGGPGCSSETAMFKENGPLKISADGDLSRNAFSWSNAMHMVYIDQPLGTGFSVAGEWLNYATDEQRVSEFLREFLLKFIKKYPSMQDRQLILSGESFAGHFIPSLADLLLQDPVQGLKLSGMALGNAWVNPRAQYLSMPYFSLLSKLITDEQYPAAVKSFETCVQLIDAKLWPVALLECNAAAALLLDGLNPYDIRLKCEAPPLCYDFTSLEDFMNTPVIQARLGVDKKWEYCSTYVRMFMLGDWITGVQEKVSHLLDEGLSVLVYSGDKDFICNWVGGVSWTMNLKWNGSEGYNATELSPWMVDNVAAGEARSHGNLSFLRIYGAGHMSPMDKPKEALAMMKEFVKTKHIRPTSTMATPATEVDIEFSS